MDYHRLKFELEASDLTYHLQQDIIEATNSLLDLQSIKMDIAQNGVSEAIEEYKEFIYGTYEEMVSIINSLDREDHYSVPDLISDIFSEATLRTIHSCEF